MTSVSICIPVFNGEAHLRTCIESVLAQSFEDIEVIIVDDGSTDNSKSIISEIAASDMRVRSYFNDKNLGLVRNWNRCIALSKRKWIKFVFQDDFIEPCCVERLVQSGESSGCPLVACDRSFVFDNVAPEVVKEYEGFPTISMVAAGKNWISPEDIIFAVNEFKYANFVGEPTSTLIRRDIFDSMGAFLDELIQLCDLEFWIRVGIHHGIAYTPGTLAHFRVHYGGTSAMNNERKRYRMDVIDPLVIAREFAFSPAYEPLRMIGKSFKMNFEKRFYDQFIMQRCHAEKYKDKGRFDRREFLSRVEALNLAFPTFNLPLTERLRLFLRLVSTNAMRQFDRHVGWRFSSPRTTRQ